MHNLRLICPWEFADRKFTDLANRSFHRTGRLPFGCGEIVFRAGFKTRSVPTSRARFKTRLWPIFRAPIPGNSHASEGFETTSRNLHISQGYETTSNKRGVPR